jgi:hypothetical protein
MADQPNNKHPGAKPLSQFEAEAQALREKTARLRALRLAHEATTKPVAEKRSAPRSGAGKKTKREPAKSVPLADWLSAQEDTGRRK